jgi:hypothetical protein
MLFKMSQWTSGRLYIIYDVPLLAKGSSPPLIEANAELTGISACHTVPIRP